MPVLGTIVTVIGGGIAGSALTYGLTWFREHRRMQDAYRAPQRQAIGGIVAATHDLVLRAYEFRLAIQNLADQADGAGKRSSYSDQELDVITSQVNRAIIGIDEAFAVGKLTIVDAQCYEMMVIAYKEFQKVQTAFVDLESMDRTSANLRRAVEPVVIYAVQLKRDVVDLVSAGKERVAPVQSRRSKREMERTHARLDAKYQLKK